MSLEQAQSEMDLISKRLEQEYPQANAGWGAVVVPLQELLVGDVRMSLVMLLARRRARAADRLRQRRQPAVRACAGSTEGARHPRGARRRPRPRVSAGADRGARPGRRRRCRRASVARTSLAAAATLLADQIPRANEISIDVRVVLFVVGVSILTGILAGGLPASARRPRGSERRAERRRTARQRRRRAHPARADRLRGRALARPADGCRRHAAQPRGAASRRRRVRSAERADDERLAARDAGTRRRHRSGHSSIARWSACARFPAWSPRAQSTICRRRADRFSRSCSRVTPSCCRAISRPSPCARSRRTTCAR